MNAGNTKLIPVDKLLETSHTQPLLCKHNDRDKGFSNCASPCPTHKIIKFIRLFDLNLRRPKSL